ncbi:MAG: amylo-alpha-1,6-glucosidase [Candidatus Desulfofervidaceae bacterium]|nr:amylo-alpha-1,6-glucosidase [Candidatus Desulfofervidaceae bacterium]
MGLEPQKYYILTPSPQVEETCLVLKQGESFAVFNRYGDIPALSLGQRGIYHEGTRFVSQLEFCLCNTRPFFLSSSVSENNLFLVVDLTNPDMLVDESQFLPRGSLHILRSKFLYEGGYYERIKIQNFAPFPITLPFSFTFAADFADIFEVRGTKRKTKGEFLKGILDKNKVVLRYKGLDGILRQTTFKFSLQPDELSLNKAQFYISINPKETVSLFLTISCQVGESISKFTYKDAFIKTQQQLKELKKQTPRIWSSNEQFNAWLKRSLSDIFMMLTETPFGLYPYAGIPWFSTVFGRDGIITALECLWLNPFIARGVLSYLAATQAKTTIPEKDAEPGKIIHEIRKGEMAATGEIPFGQYYGSVDATPLFLILAGSYYERTRDKEFIESIWPNIELALKWIDEYGDLDGDGFVEYLPSPNGLVNKGWKDSHESVFHTDGTLAKGPIALVEVQAYVYAAKRKTAYLALILGKEKLAVSLWQEAERLKERFEKVFWCDEINCYALALDGEKRPCKVRTSNAGHCLFAEIADPKHAAQMAQLFLERHFFSGWGIRTVSSQEVSYNPLSYHNGSVWPHDNAIIAYGLSRYGLKEGVLKIMEGLFDASMFFPFHRVPELFCGLPHRPHEGPTHYPVACNPQSWAAAAVFLLLQACLGLHYEGKKVYFYYPVLPPFLEEVYIKNLTIYNTSLDLYFKRYENDVVINVMRKNKDIEVFILK